MVHEIVFRPEDGNPYALACREIVSHEPSRKLFQRNCISCRSQRWTLRLLQSPKLFYHKYLDDITSTPPKKLTVRTCQEAGAQKRTHLPTIDFKGRTISFREGIPLAYLTLEPKATRRLKKQKKSDSLYIHRFYGLRCRLKSQDFAGPLGEEFSPKRPCCMNTHG